MDVITREADDVNALTTDDKYFKIAPVINPIYTVLNITIFTQSYQITVRTA